MRTLECIVPHPGTGQLHAKAPKTSAVAGLGARRRTRVAAGECGGSDDGLANNDTVSGNKRSRQDAKENKLDIRIARGCPSSFKHFGSNM